MLVKRARGVKSGSRSRRLSKFFPTRWSAKSRRTTSSSWEWGTWGVEILCKKFYTQAVQIWTVTIQSKWKGKAKKRYAQSSKLSIRSTEWSSLPKKIDDWMTFWGLGANSRLTWQRGAVGLASETDSHLIPTRSSRFRNLIESWIRINTIISTSKAVLQLSTRSP